MQNQERVFDNTAKLIFFAFFIVCACLASLEYYKSHNCNVAYTIGCVIGNSYMKGEGDPGIDFFYIVKGKVIKSNCSDGTLRDKRLGDSIIVRYVLNDPGVASIVDSIGYGETCEHPYISDSLKYTLYYSN